MHSRYRDLFAGIGAPIDVLVGSPSSFSSEHVDHLNCTTIGIVLEGEKRFVVHDKGLLGHCLSTANGLKELAKAANTRVVTLKAGMGILVPAKHAHAAVNVTRCVSLNISVCRMRDVPQLLWGIVHDATRGDGSFPQLGKGFVQLLQDYTKSLEKRACRRALEKGLVQYIRDCSGPGSRDEGAIRWASKQMSRATEWTALLCQVHSAQFWTGISQKMVHAELVKAKRVIYG